MAHQSHLFISPGLLTVAYVTLEGNSFTGVDNYALPFIR